jgi:predicted NACHT family NTPase
LDIFDDSAGSLLMLGEAGAGKTTLMLELARDLLDRADNDSSQPVSVVLNLASWGRRRQPLLTWLAEELALTYKVPRRVAQEWIQADAICLLLDGLDEVAWNHRANCAESINAFRNEHGLIPLLVTCRSRDLTDLAVTPDVEEVVELQPLTDAQVDSFIEGLAVSGNPAAGPIAALRQRHEVQHLLHSPLTLQVLTLSHEGG